MLFRVRLAYQLLGHRWCTPTKRSFATTCINQGSKKRFGDAITALQALEDEHPQQLPHSTTRSPVEQSIDVLHDLEHDVIPEMTVSSPANSSVLKSPADTIDDDAGFAWLAGPDVLRLKYFDNKVSARGFRRKSYNWLKRNRPTPYFTLYNAIRTASPDCARLYRPPELARDKSCQNPLDHIRQSSRGNLPQHHDIWGASILDTLPTMWSILAKVIVNQQTSTSIRLNQIEQRFMDNVQYTLADFETWASIVMDENTDQTIFRTYKLSTEPLSDSAPPRVPLVVISLLLKRHFISGNSLQMLVACSWTALRSNPLWIHPQNAQIFVLFARLVRHAARVAPVFLPNIAYLFVQFTPVYDSLDSHGYMTTMYNSALGMLAISSGEAPFRAAQHQAQAQFLLVSHMLTSNPPYQLTSHGFAALVKGHLKYSRTAQESEWAGLQARSWPPYSRPKTAMDEDKGIGFAASRAVKTLNHMRQAGYSFPQWESIARIYAGWEADGTPSIQTRHLNFPTKLNSITTNWDARLWAARIAVSRDIREAWAQFLKCETSGLAKSFEVYWPMFVKLSEEHKRLSSDRYAVRSHTMPGEMKEVIEPATSPMQKVYLPNEPPSFMDLVKRMTESSIMIPTPFLGALLEMSPSVRDAVDLWKLIREDKEDLMTEIVDSKLQRTNEQIKWATYIGLIAVLCKHPWEKCDRLLFDEHRTAQLHTYILDTFAHSRFRARDASTRAFFQALDIVRRTQPKLPIVYNMLLQGLIRIQNHRGIDRIPPTIWFYQVVLEILALVKKSGVTMEATFFDNFCHFLERCAKQSYDLEDEASHSQNYSTTNHIYYPTAKAVLSTGGTLLRRSFAALYGRTLAAEQLKQSMGELSNEPQIPLTAAVPSPLTLQHYIRALAIFHDYEGIYSLALWCEQNTKALIDGIGELPRGLEQWEHTRTLFRVVLEQPAQLFFNLPMINSRPADADLTALVRKVVQNLDTIGGWASDDDVEAYLTYVRHESRLQSHRFRVQTTR